MAHEYFHKNSVSTPIFHTASTTDRGRVGRLSWGGSCQVFEPASDCSMRYPKGKFLLTISE
jgi:hypothetical protein